MLTPVQRKKRSIDNARFAIVASTYNARYVGCDAAGAKTEILKAGDG